MFRVGMKVVCVDAGDLGGGATGNWDPDEEPVEGRVYTVHRTLIFWGHPIVHLVELQRSDLSRAIWGDDVGYGVERFRPVVSRPTSIAIFHAILNGAPVKEVVL